MASSTLVRQRSDQRALIKRSSPQIVNWERHPTAGELTAELHHQSQETELKPQAAVDPAPQVKMRNISRNGSDAGMSQNTSSICPLGKILLK